MENQPPYLQPYLQESKVREAAILPEIDPTEEDLPNINEDSKSVKVSLLDEKLMNRPRFP